MVLSVLSAKPDFERARTAWNHFWNGEVYKRPLVLAGCYTAPRQVTNLREDMYHYAMTGNYQAQLDLIDAHLERYLYLGELMPAFGVNHGPDQYAAFLGAELQFTDSSHFTNWVAPIADDWDTFLPLTFDERNPIYQSVLRFARLMAKHGAGRYLVSPIDAHSHADALSALRGHQQFALDLLLCPEQVERAMRDARPLFARIYDAVYAAGNMGGAKGCCQGSIWSEGKCGIIQCDFIYLIGPHHFRRFILPAIEAEAGFLDHSYFHLDGPGSFRHRDDLLSLKRLGVISVDPGAGQPPNHTWVEHLKRIVAAGKGARVYGQGLDLDRIKVLHRELGPKGVIYCPAVRTRQEVEAIMDWLERHT